MVETKTTVQPKSEDPRAKIREDRERRLKMIRGDRPSTIKVFAANEEMQRALMHPTGVRFRDDINEAAEWPNDSFTARRIADGSVSTEGGGAGKQAKPEEQETMNARQIAAARKPKAEPQPEAQSAKTEGKQRPQPPV